MRPETVEGETFQRSYLTYLAKGDFDGLVDNCFSSDARIHTFGYRAGGSVPLSGFLRSYIQRLQQFDKRSVDFFAADKDYVWQELALRDSQGILDAVDVYEFKFLRDGKVFLQLVGEKSDTGWVRQAFAAAGAETAGSTESDGVARSVHHRYIDYQARGDADGMADDFFTADVRLATAKVNIEGRETLRRFFRQKFEEEQEFRLVSVRNLTGDKDYVWFEATAASSLGERTVYDVMLLQEESVHLQLVGTLDGGLPVNEQ